MTRKANETTNKAYRIITDEPVGLAVGFKPSDELLKQLNAEVDEWNIVEDDGTDSIPWFDDEENNPGGQDIMIRDINLEDGIDQGLSPLGMDLLIWRSEEELKNNWVY